MSNSANGLPTSEKAKADTGQFFTYINVKFNEKDQAKALGAKWDKNKKSWYVPAGVDRTPFGQWIDAKATQRLEFEQEFAMACEAAGLILPDGHPVMDGTWQHVPVNTSSKVSAKKGAYKAFINTDDGIVADGYIMNHDTNYKKPWKPSELNMTAEQVEAFRKSSEINKQLREQETAAEQEAVSKAATAKWNSLPVCESHAYLDRKGVLADGVRLDSDKLVIPARDMAGKIWTLQSISHSADGPKMFEKGGRKNANFHVVGELEGAPVVIYAEGYATGKSINMATGYPVIIAFDSGNLLGVMEAVRPMIGNRAELIGADDDVLDNFKVAKTILSLAQIPRNESLNLHELLHKDIQIGAGPVKMLSNPDCVIDLRHVEIVPGVQRVVGTIQNTETKFTLNVTITNSGREKATEASLKLNVEAIYPQFSDKPRGLSLSPKVLTDFNDLHASEGLAAVKNQISMGAIKALARNTPEFHAKEHLGADAVVQQAKDNRRYSGQVIANTSGHSVQNVGKSTAVAHDLQKLDRVPVVGTPTKIVYEGGKGKVLDNVRANCVNER